MKIIRLPNSPFFIILQSVVPNRPNSRVVGFTIAGVACLLLFWLTAMAEWPEPDLAGGTSRPFALNNIKDVHLPLLPVTEAIFTGKNDKKLPQTISDVRVAPSYEYLTDEFNSLKPKVNILARTSLDTPCHFCPTVSVGETVLMREILVAFVEAAEKLNITYFMTYGTLLGAYRHDGLIPWDDDLDVMISSTDEDKMYTALHGLAPRYDCVPYGQRLKLFSPLGDTISPIQDYYPFTFPSLDIFLYNNTEEILWDVAYYGGEIALATVFPLVKMQFWGLSLNAPKDSLRYLEELGYEVYVCKTNSYDHRQEEVLNNIVAVSCKDLEYLYPTIGQKFGNKNTVT